MAPKWQAKDDYFETCNCRTLCPCISLGPPTEGNCTVLEWHIESVAAEAHVRVTRFVFGPPSPWPIAFRVMGPDPAQGRVIADQVLARAQANPHARQANEDWTERAPTAHFVLDQDRLS
jgi:hypothetical protein